MAWMKYNKETKKVARAAVLVSDLEKFDSIVMDNATWSAINTFSDRVPWGRHSRMNTFVDDLLDELKRKEAETDEPFSSQPWKYIIHIDLDESKNTALVSIQRNNSYEFAFKNIRIPLKEL